MNHKRGKPKNARAGCLMCKYFKQNGMKHLMRYSHARQAMKGVDDKRYPKMSADLCY